MLFVINSREWGNAVPQVSCSVRKAVGSSVSLDHPVGLAFAIGLARPLLDSKSTLNSSFSFIWEAMVRVSDPEATPRDVGPASAI